MSVLENFKNIPRSPSHRATGPKCNFFLQICNEVTGEEKKRGLSPPDGRQGPVAHPWGDRGLSPVERATGALGGRTWRVGAGMSAAPRPRLNSEEEKVGNFLADRGNKKTWVSLRIHGACHCVQTVRAFVR